MSSDTAIFKPGRSLADEHKNHIASLLFSTSYLEYCSFGNKLNLPLRQLQRRQNVDPYLDQLTGLFDGAHRFSGFFTAATLAEFGNVGSVSHYRDEMKPMDDAYDAFIAAHARDGDFFVASLAVAEHCRGQGWFNIMLKEIERRAREKNSQRIVLTVWENSDALQVYLKKGFRSSGIFDYAYPLFFDRLHLLEYDEF
ncbi:GNAT family N-acetyltransferase [Janthinobacterium agaricidamnosum]|uniref:Acetyltransferase family protein n=1 Tax=Janthinobacterium agaricidamnosum NBRC 102515 = DSM 9628 TaxID=1349767 RepID=W0V107_9BURK|nr:GNAT family N-acetyltransferase [Janthinobacterium agaricidamnosum]CDG81013.1 acetyltransferase family protein [Janthinobacterium agaricidamnosum NBRC 102515 = DSM 9628]